MKKILTAIICALIVVGCGTKIYFVNSEGIKQEEKNYKLNEEVEFENNFFNNKADSSDGYSVTVLGSEIVDREQFKKDHDINEDIGIELIDYFCLVKVKFANVSNKNGSRSGISIMHFILQNEDYITFPNKIVYPLVNKSDNLNFSLDEDSSAEIVIPFAILNDDITAENFKDGSPQLVISLYPTKKAIALK